MQVSRPVIRSATSLPVAALMPIACATGYLVLGKADTSACTMAGVASCLAVVASLFGLGPVMNMGRRLVRKQSAGAQRTQDDIGFFGCAKPLTDAQAAVKAADFIDDAALKKQRDRRHRNIAKA